MEADVLLRVACFLGTLFFVATWELIYPRRQLIAAKGTRWFSNLSIVLINSLLLRIVFPITTLGVAAFASQRGWGLLRLIDLSYPAQVVLSVVVLDFAIYLQHVMFHTLPSLWRVHRMHHSDVDIDASTGVRFHPIEIVISMGLKFAVIILCGAPALAVLIFEVLLNATSMFNHANIFIPLKIDKLLRLVLVTPDMHRVHHSIYPNETHSNFGFNLAWWDRLFGTYRAQPRNGHTAMKIGIELFRESKYLRLGWLLLIPFL